MFEREIKFIYDFNLNKVNKLGPYFTFEQLTSSGVHPAILHYISAEIDYLIFEDRQQLLKNSVFDYSGEKISLLFSQISDEVKHTKRFSLEYISKLILHASSFTVNFLVRPKWTLVKFVFDEGDHKMTSEIKQILNYLYYYKHLKSILISYITSKKIISMNSEEFKELLNKVDHLGVETYLPSILSGALNSMAEFFNIGEVQKNRIPLIAMQMFLEEKQLAKHLERIRSVFGEDGNTKFHKNEYQKEFDGILPEKVEPVPEEKEKERFKPVIVEQHDIESEDKIDVKGETIPENDQTEEQFIEDKIPEDDNEVEPEQNKEENEELIENKQNIEVEPEIKHKPVKIRINVKQNNEIERIDDEEVKEQEYDGVPENVEEEKGNTLFENYEENIVTDQVEESEEEIPDESAQEETAEEETEQIQDEQFDKTAEELESALDEDDNINKYDEFIEDDETREINKYADETLKNIEKKLETDEEEENESMLKSILNSENEDYDEPRGDEDAGLKSTTYKEESNTQKTDLAELLEHKEMTKIIEVVFEYDIEEFSNTLEEIMECEEIDDAFVIINQALKDRGFRRKSKEAQLFKQVISEYFDRR